MSNPLNEFDAQGYQKIECQLCQKYYHRLDVHLSKKHGITVAEYKERFPGVLTISKRAQQAASNGQTGVRRTKSQPVAQQRPEQQGQEHGENAPFKIGRACLYMRKDEELDTALDKPHIPEHDDGWVIGNEGMVQWEYFALGIEQGMKIMWVGPTGCGKTASARQLAACLNQPCQRVNMDGDIRKADFVGEKIVDVDADTGQAVTRWQDGILPTCMRRGHWLIIDEFDAAPPAILFVLQAVLEADGYLILAGNGGEIVKAHPNFRIIATANTKGRGDESGLYQGTTVMNEATLDRFGIVIEAQYPDANTEAKILTQKTDIIKKMAHKMVAVANKVRKGLENEECFCTFSTRRLLAWASMAALMGVNGSATELESRDAVRQASKIAVLNRLADEDKVFVDALIQRHMGGDV